MDRKLKTSNETFRPSFQYEKISYVESPKRGRIGPCPESNILVEKIHEEGPHSRMRGDWTGAHVLSEVPWPNDPYLVEFENTKLYLYPEKDESLPAVFLRNDRLSIQERKALISRFLSSWSWLDDRGITVSTWTNGSHMFRSGRYRPSIKTLHFDFEYLPSKLSERESLALAFFREGLSLDHAAYSFLSFFKVINVLHKGNAAQKRWISKNISKLKQTRAIERLKELRKDNTNLRIEKYIYEQCRNAVAHSHLDSMVINPDDPSGEFRLKRDLPIIEELARIVIIEELKIPSREKIRSSKTRKIAGAIWMVGPDTYKKILQSNVVSRRLATLPRKINIRNRQHPQYENMKNLNLKVRCINEGVVFLEISRDDRLMVLNAGIDFRNGKAIIEPFQNQRLIDNGSIEAAELMLDWSKFSFELCCNGQFQIFEASTDLLVGEADPYFLVNMMVNVEGAKEQQSYWESQITKRTA